MDETEKVCGQAPGNVGIETNACDVLNTHQALQDVDRVGKLNEKNLGCEIERSEVKNNESTNVISSNSEIDPNEDCIKCTTIKFSNSSSEHFANESNATSIITQCEGVPVANESENFVCSKKNPIDSGTILNPLHLNTSASQPANDKTLSSYNYPERLTLSSSPPKMLDNETPCMVCDHIETNMDTKSHHNEYLCHLIVEHKLVIADVKLVADLQSYAVYWKKRIQEESLDAFCSKIRTNTGAKDVEASEEYYLLCDALPEDKKIREELQLSNLKKLLLRQEFERKDDTFGRKCPFCSKYFQGNRIILFNHLSQDHNFNIGHPDNIVNVREFLDEIEAKLTSLQCLFCERVFKDRMALREHMRKKSHRRLNPKNKEYDKYYIINHLELGKNWEVLQGESEKLDSSSDDWSGWNEDLQGAVCFFCSAMFDEAEKVYDHMKEYHSFDFVTLRKEMPLSFYQQIKLINYIRREVHLLRQERQQNIANKVKEKIKMSTVWNQPQYYFSTYEDDNLLCLLVDKDGLFEPEDTFVIGEDGIDCRSIINSSVLTDLVVGGYFDG